MKKIIISVAVIASLVLALGACSRRTGEIGTVENPIIFYYMPFRGEHTFAEYAPEIEKYIEEHAGLEVESRHASDFITIVEAFGKKKADVAFMNTLGYLMAYDWAKAEAFLQQLYGDVYRSYRGEILVRTDSEIDNIADLQGKTIAFADPFSAGGYLYPLKLLHEKNVKPAKTVFAGGHLKAVEMLYKGEVDAAATYHTKPTAAGLERDSRVELLEKYPDIISKIKIVALTDEIPNGPIAFSKDLPEAVKTKLAGAILGFARTPKGREALMNLYNITGLTVGNNEEYDGVRKVLKDLGTSIDEVVPGGISFYRSHAEAWLEY
jgi:phosphonate transport system substrate-binding protein